MNLVGKKIITEQSMNAHGLKFYGLKSIQWYNNAQRFHIENNPGFLRAFQSTIINTNWRGMEKDYRSLQTSHALKVLVLWGSNDSVVPTYLAPKVQELIPSAKLHILEGYSHSLPMEDIELVVGFISDFFK